MNTVRVPSVVFDTDPGADDALAMLWLCALHARGRANLTGVTTVGGNVGARDTFTNAERLLQLCAMGDVPLARGAVTAGEHATHVHGADGLAGLRAQLPEAQRDYETAAAAEQVLSDLWQRHGGETTLAAVGPLTNLAAAVELDAKALHRIPRIVVMGGALETGNITRYAEFNVYHDPHSWATALANARLEVVPLEQTHKVFFSQNELQKTDLVGPVGDFARRLIHRMCRDGAKRTGRQQFFLHDAVVVAAICYPETVRFRDASLRVVLTGERLGAVREMRHREPNARVACEVDTPAIKAALLDDLQWFASR
ncbi:MAG: nucleoside hydrolase [Gammaproteobacteria bacterium]